MKKIKNKKRFLFSLVLAFLFLSVDILAPGVINTLTQGKHSSIVYAKPRTGSSFKSSGFSSSSKSSSIKSSSSKSSSSGFKSGSFTTPKSMPGSSSSSKSSSGGFMSGLFGKPKTSQQSSGSTTTTPNYNTSSTKRSILPIPIPIPWGTTRHYSSPFGSFYSGPGYFIGSLFSGFLRLIILIIIISIIIRIIKNNRRR